jgi:RNA recognition motif-containing protein
VNKTIHIGNLAMNVTETDLKEFFARCGKISRSSVSTHLEKKDVKFAFIEFESEEGSKNALSLNGIKFAGKELKIDLSRSPILQGQKLKPVQNQQFQGGFNPFVPMIHPQFFYYTGYFLPQQLVGEKRTRNDNQDENTKKIKF